MKRSLSRSPLLAVLIGALLVAGTAAAPALATSPVVSTKASSPSCGDMITVNTTLHSDLINCPGNGIVMGADNITLNLNGHTLAGVGVSSTCAPSQDCDAGVDNLAGHSGVMILGGTILGFRFGVRARGVHDNVVEDVSASHNARFGIFVQNSTETSIEGSSMSGNGISGLLLTDSQDSSLRSNSVTGSHGYGIFLRNVSDSLVHDNTLVGNDHGIGGEGLAHDSIRGNSISHSGGSSLDVGGTNNRIEHNRLSENGDGIVTPGDNNLISYNVISGTGFYGFPDAGGFGLILDGAKHTTVIGNSITGGRGPAIYVTSLDSPTPSRDNEISRNVANSRLDTGIIVDNGATGTVIERNRASGNGDDGIRVSVASTTLTGNIANNNNDLGIEAVPGVVDGGGNRAAGNGNPAQCLNIVCLP